MCWGSVRNRNQQGWVASLTLALRPPEDSFKSGILILMFPSSETARSFLFFFDSDSNLFQDPRFLSDLSAFPHGTLHTRFVPKIHFLCVSTYAFRSFRKCLLDLSIPSSSPLEVSWLWISFLMTPTPREHFIPYFLLKLFSVDSSFKSNHLFGFLMIQNYVHSLQQVLNSLRCQIMFYIPLFLLVLYATLGRYSMLN